MSKINLNDLIGKNFNRLTILEAKREKHKIIVKCKCDCGNIKEYDYNAVRRNNTKSCGCLHKINLNDLIGKKFNRLTILEARRNTKLKIIVKCKCDCGNIKEYFFRHIKINQTKSCGCYIKELITNRNIKHNFNVFIK